MKSATDIHWSQRAASVRDDHEVNIMDVFQRDLEYEQIERYLRPDMRMLETGCGNGYSTARFRQRVRHVDAFDYSEQMIARARASVGETNNRFLHDNLLDPRLIEAGYDTVLCVRVLINLRDLDEQRRAFRNLLGRVRAGGRLILVEGYRDGFLALSRLRAAVGLPPVEPASINFYSALADLRPHEAPDFELEDQFHLGAYDYLTRVAYPLLVGAENVTHNSVFSEKCRQLAASFNPDAFRELSRIRGFVLRRTG